MEKNGKKPTAKSRGAFHVLRLAFYVLRRRSNSKPAAVRVQVVEKSSWRRLMCFMRPLHSPCLQPSGAPALAIKEHGEDDSFHDEQTTHLPPPSSPDNTAPRLYEDGMSSRYTSAEDLCELEEMNGGAAIAAGGDDDRLEEVRDGEESDDPNEIDMQAEEFIAKFYEQMRLQRAESLKRYNRWLQKQQAGKEEEKEEEEEQEQERSQEEKDEKENEKEG